MAETDNLAGDLIARADNMKSARSNEEFHWQEVRDQIAPMMQRYVGDDPVGAKSNQYTIDETPEQAHELLTNALHGMVMNPSIKWAEIEDADAKIMENQEAAAWYAHATDRTFSIMYGRGTNAKGAQHECLQEVTGVGTGVLFTGERIGRGPVLQARPLRECFVAEGEEGRVDTLFRRFEMTARQAVQKWGDKAGKKAVEMAGKAREQDKKLTFLHAVYPNGDRASRAAGPRGMAFASVYVAIDDKATIGQGGYHEFPYAVPRWYKRAGEIYGRGPGTKGLPSAKALQKTMKLTLRGAEKQIDPALMVADDGVLSKVRLHSAGITTVRAELLARGNVPIRPIETGGQAQLGEEIMEGMRNRIQASFYNHLLRMSQDPRMTATQVIQISEETIRIIGPMLGRLQDELLDPFMQRLFAMLYRAGAFDPPPPILWGREPVITFISPAAQAQKLAEAKGIVQTFDYLVQLAQIDPSVWDNFDVDEASRQLGIMLGMPRFLMRDPRQVVTIREAREKKQADAQAIADARQIAGGIKDAASALPDIRGAMAPDGQQAA